MTARSRIRPGRIVLGGLVGLLAACVLLEAAGRLYIRSKGHSWSARTGNAKLVRAHDSFLTLDWRIAPAEARPQASEQAHALHPFAGFESIGGQRDLPARAHATRRAPPGTVFEVGVVGGSVSCIVVEHSAERLASRLQASPKLAGRRVRVHPLGQATFKQPQQVSMVQWAFANGMRLDALVNIDGFNEIALANQNAQSGSHPLYPYFPTWSHAVHGSATSDAALSAFARMQSSRDATRAWCISTKDSPLLASAVLGNLIVIRAQRGVREFSAAQRDYVAEIVRGERENLALSGPWHPPDLEAVLDSSSEAWVQGSLSLSAICEERGVRYLHVLQPTLHDRGSKPLTAEEHEKGAAPLSLVESVPVGYPRLRAQTARLRELGVDFLDASYLFVDDPRTLYYDNCHFGAEGCDMLVARIAEHLLSHMP